ncbi:MAG: hypothetical protein AB7E36_13950 [Salinivirgaceae bacterium]
MNSEKCRSLNCYNCSILKSMEMRAGKKKIIPLKGKQHKQLKSGLSCLRNALAKAWHFLRGLKQVRRFTCIVNDVKYEGNGSQQ